MTSPMTSLALVGAAFAGLLLPTGLWALGLLS